MGNSNLKWYFPKAENVSGRGENEPQKELFPGEVYQTMIRESIQNSLDHPDCNATGPVRVEYKLYKCLTEDYDMFKNDLREHIQSCFDLSQADKFKRMLEVLSLPSFYVLEVSDFNTIGMDYDYDTDTGRFKKFVRYTGDPNKVAGAGGSHGYGKITYFSVSEINTIIVSSMTNDNVCTFEGVSRLATHPAGQPRWSYYDTGFLDLGDGVPIQNVKGDPNTEIPDAFSRPRVGTTVYIPFANIDDGKNTKEIVFNRCCEAVLRNFFAAINDGKLDVIIDFSDGELIKEAFYFECNKDRIEDIFNKRFFYNPPYDKARYSIFDKFNPHPYWLAYRNNEVTVTDELSEEEAVELCAGKKYVCFKNKLPILGEVSFFVNVDLQRGNDLILFMRSPRMVVGVQHNTSSRGYSAVFLCDDKGEGKGNELLRNMEDAAHRTWSKRQLRIDKRPQEMIDKAGQIEKEMTDYIRWCLNIVFPSSEKDSEDVELDDFTIPLISESDTTNPLIGGLINKQGYDDNTLGAPVDIHAKTSSPKKKSSFIGKAQVVEPKQVKTTKEKTEISGGNGGGGGGGNLTGKKKDYEEDPSGEEKTVRVKFPVKYRIFFDDEGDGNILYTLIIHSSQPEEKAYLTLTPVGETEDKSCNVHVQSSSVGSCHENEIIGVPLIEGKNVITFRVDNAGEYAFTLLAEHDVTIKE